MAGDIIVGPAGGCAQCYRHPCVCRETSAQRAARERAEAAAVRTVYVVAATYMRDSMAMPNHGVDQEQNWILGHMVTFGHALLALERGLLLAPAAPGLAALSPAGQEAVRALRAGLPQLRHSRGFGGCLHCALGVLLQELDGGGGA